MLKVSKLALCLGAAFILSACDAAVDTGDASLDNGNEQQSTSQRPNLLLIIADDLGYTDLGVYGGEIDTPNIDQLAEDGLLFTDFHNQAVCAPTRAALLSGTDNHNAGGAMHQTAAQKGVPGYESDLNFDVVTLPRLLNDNGYNTYWAGKWHLGHTPETLPTGRGFDKGFALRQGGASHFSDMKGMFSFSRVAEYYDAGKRVEKLPDDFYSSDFYTDYIMDAIAADRASGDPFFAVLAFTAPHWPLQAPKEYIDKYKGIYDDGYEALRENRIAKGKTLGVIPQSAEAYPRLKAVKPWDDLTAQEKAISSKEMQVYAGMVDSLDKNVGRLIADLKKNGEYDNTFIMFISDNGAEGQDRNPRENGTDWTFDRSLENMGLVNSYVTYGPEWAQAGVGVMRYYKSLSSEGGTRGPAIIRSPILESTGEISDQFASVVDVMPSFLELARVEHPGETYKGRKVKPPQGRSFIPYLKGEAESVHPKDFVYGWEVLGHRAIRKGDYKLLYLASKPSERGQTVPEKSDHWGLYNVKTDPGETRDLSADQPELLAALLSEWESYVAENGIVLAE